MPTSDSHEDFDPRAAEFGGAELAPASIATLEAIGSELDQLLKSAHGHPVVEHAIVHEGNPVIFKKHRELSYIDNTEVEHNFPLGEFTIYDKSCDRMAVNYSIYPDGSVHRMPGFLNGFNWDPSQGEAEGEDEIVEVTPIPEQDWPGPLSDVEIDALASMMFDLLGVDAVNRLTGKNGVLQALEIAATRGVKAVEKDELHLVTGKILDLNAQVTEPGATKNDEINIEASSRDRIQPGIETAVRYIVRISENISDTLTDNYRLIIYENNTSELKFRRSDMGLMPDIKTLVAKGGVHFNGEEFTAEDMQRRIDQRNEFIHWQNEMRAAGLHFASEEQVGLVAGILKDMSPRVSGG